MKKVLKVLLIVLLVSVILFGILYFFAGERIKNAVKSLPQENKVLQVLVVKPYLFLDNVIVKVREGGSRNREPIVFKESAEYKRMTEDVSSEQEDAKTDPVSYFVVAGKKYVNPEIKGLQIPSYVEGKQAIDHSPYLALQYDIENKVPIWIAYTLDTNKVRNLGLASGGSIIDDPLLVGEGSVFTAIANAGYTIMPLALFGEFNWSDQALEVAMYDTNFVASDLGGNNPWTEISKTIRNYVEKSGDTVYIVAGTVCASDSERLSDGTAVADLFWKAVLQYNSDGAKAIAYIVANREGKAAASAVSVNQVELLTGLDLFPALPDSIEEIIESDYVLSDWE